MIRATLYIPFMFYDQPSIQKGKSIHNCYLPVEDTGLFTPVDNNTLKYIPVYLNPSDGIFYINTQNYNIKIMECIRCKRTGFEKSNSVVSFGSN